MKLRFEEFGESGKLGIGWPVRKRDGTWTQTLDFMLTDGEYGQETGTVWFCCVSCDCSFGVAMGRIRRACEAYESRRGWHARVIDDGHIYPLSEACKEAWEGDSDFGVELAETVAQISGWNCKKEKSE